MDESLSTAETIACNKMIVHKLLLAFQDQRWEDVRALMTDDAIWWVSGSTIVSGSKPRDALIAQADAALAGGTTPFRFEMGTMTAEEDRVAVELEASMGLPNGGTYRNAYHMLFRIRGDQVASVREHLDTDAVSRIFG